MSHTERQAAESWFKLIIIRPEEFHNNSKEVKGEKWRRGDKQGGGR